MVTGESFAGRGPVQAGGEIDMMRIPTPRPAAGQGTNLRDSYYVVSGG